MLRHANGLAAQMGLVRPLSQLENFQLENFFDAQHYRGSSKDPSARDSRITLLEGGALYFIEDFSKTAIGELELLVSFKNYYISSECSWHFSKTTCPTWKAQGHCSPACSAWLLEPDLWPYHQGIGYTWPRWGYAPKAPFQTPPSYVAEWVNKAILELQLFCPPWKHVRPCKGRLWHSFWLTWNLHGHKRHWQHPKTVEERVH